MSCYRFNSQSLYSLKGQTTRCSLFDGRVLAADVPISVPDDPTIPSAWALLRRIHPNQIVRDKNKGMPRPSSAAFRDPNLSVDMEAILHSNGFDWKFSLASYPGYSLVRFTAGEARAQNQAIVRSPLAHNPAHGEVVGAKPKPVQTAFTQFATWAYLIESR